MTKKATTVTRYRDSSSGRFLTDRKGDRKPPHEVVRERIPKPGHGTSKSIEKANKEYGPALDRLAKR